MVYRVNQWRRSHLFNLNTDFITYENSFAFAKGGNCNFFSKSGQKGKCQKRLGRLKKGQGAKQDQDEKQKGQDAKQKGQGAALC